MKGSRAVEKEVRLKTPCITLGQLLKIENIVSSGGDEVVVADQGKFVMKSGE